MLRARDVSVEFGGCRILTGVSIEVRAGKVLGILGSNGAGKSTLLKVLAGHMRPTSGSVEIEGKPLGSHGVAMLASIRAVVPQATAMSFQFTVSEVVALGIGVPGFRRADSDRIVQRCIAEVGLGDLATRGYSSLSGGEQQRVNLARALAQLEASPRPGGGALLLLDEPTASLDLKHQSTAMAVIEERARKGLAVAIVLHDLNLAAAWCDEVLLLAGGSVKAVGRPAEVFSARSLSEAYGCPLRPNVMPAGGRPFVLPLRADGDCKADTKLAQRSS